jgi:hypothetical protein
MQPAKYSHRVEKAALWIIYALLIFILFKGVYLAIIGGTGLYVGLSGVLLWLVYTLPKNNKVLRICSAILLILVIGYLVVLQQWLLCIPVLLALGLWYLKTRSNHKVYLMGLVLMLLSLVMTTIMVSRDLTILKQHNAAFQNGESWQKYGAL